MDENQDLSILAKESIRTAIERSLEMMRKFVSSIDFRIDIMQCAKEFDFLQVIREAQVQAAERPDMEELKTDVLYRYGFPELLKTYQNHNPTPEDGLAFIASPVLRLSAQRYLLEVGMAKYLERALQLVDVGLMSFEVRNGVMTFIYKFDQHDKIDAMIESCFRQQEADHLAKLIHKTLVKISDRIEQDVELNVRPWHEKLIAYDSTPLLDEVFSSRAIAYSLSRMDHDVFDRTDMFGGIPYSAYHHAVTMQTMFAMKHDLFVSKLAEINPRCSLPDCYTITASEVQVLNGLKRGLEEFGYTEEDRALAKDVVKLRQVLSVISLNSTNATALINSGEPLPHLIQHTPSSYIRLRTGAFDNPYAVMRRALSYAFPRDYSRAQRGQETRQIEIIQAGVERRFKSLQMVSNIKIKKNGTILTDIDVVILDLDRAEVYLVQLKHQDPYGVRVDVRQSRKKKLLEETGRWLLAVSKWLNDVDLLAFLKDTGLKVRKSIKHIEPKLLIVSMHHGHFLADLCEDFDFEYASWHAFIDRFAHCATFDEVISQVSRHNDDTQAGLHMFDIMLFSDINFMGLNINSVDERRRHV